jgi:hypothetical protein
MSLRAAPALVLGVLLAPASTFARIVWRATLGSGQILLLLTAWAVAQ